MSFSRSFVCVVFAFALASFSASSTQTRAEAQEKAAATHSAAETALLDTETSRFNAQVAADVKALEQLIADDAIYIHATGQMQTKAEYLHDVAAGTSKYRSIETADRTVKIVGDTGITHGSITLNVGVDRQINARYTGVYVRRGDRWLVLSFQTTPLTQRQ